MQHQTEIAKVALELVAILNYSKLNEASGLAALEIAKILYENERDIEHMETFKQFFIEKKARNAKGDDSDEESADRSPVIDGVDGLGE